MPYEIKKTPSCPVSKPFGVFNKNTGTLDNRCHVSRAKALAQMRALYAAESGKMNSEAAVVTLVKSFSDEWLDDNRKWIKVYPYSSWTHPVFSDTAIDEETAKALKDSFDRKLYGEQDYVVTYDHGLDSAKGGKAAGWYEQLEVRDDGLWGLVRFTDIARQEIDAGEWRYFSGEHYDEYKHPHTGEVNNLVFSGGAITNKPYVKEGMVPLNFSDVYVERSTMDTPAGEHVPEEHADPGQTTEPPTEGLNEDDSEGSRLTPKPEENVDGVTDSALDKAIREKLGLDPEADIVKAVTDMYEEVKPLRDAAKAHSEKKSFAEQYPAEAAKLERHDAREREINAKAFSDKFARLTDKDGKPTSKGYPAIVLEKLTELHKSFSEGKATVSDVEEAMVLMARTGTVDFTETGSSRSESFDDETPADKKFAEKVVEIMHADKLDYASATKIATEKHPELFEAYRNSLPGSRR